MAIADSQLSRAAGVIRILAATAVAGVAGYLTQAFVLAASEPSRYVSFSVFWSGLYLVIGTLSGIQQEVSRASRAVETSTGGSRVVAIFAAGAAALVLVVLVATGLLWGPVVFPREALGSVVALAIGAASYVLVAVYCGTLYGLARWTVLMFMIGIDAVLRLLFVATSVVFEAPLTVTEWAVVAPFPLTLLIVGLIARSPGMGALGVDVGPLVLSWNTARTVAAAAATAVIMSGFPLLIGATASNRDSTIVAGLIAAITLTRAPILIPLLSLQSYLVVYLRDHAERLWRTISVLLTGIVIVTALLALAAWAWGPWILSLFGEGYAIDGALIALVVASAACTASMFVSGPAVLSRDGHYAYAAGWVVAAVVVVAVALSPLELSFRSVLALAVGPVLGLALHLFALARARARAAEVRQA